MKNSDKSFKKKTSSRAWVINYFPMLLDPDSLVPSRQIILDWYPEAAMDSGKSLDELLSELTESLKGILNG